VTVITTAEADGGVHGMTANGVVSVSLEPPLALVSVGHNRNSHPLIRRNRRYGISILTTRQRDIAVHFTRPPEQRPPDAAISYRKLGKSMVIEGALGAMDCRVVSEHEEGDHTLFVAQVEAIEFGDGDPLVWYRGQFGDFAPADIPVR
jgi:flavin reductase (DIM6/NTAB) family NADH-FMN oxidoreductase RutF